MASETTTRVMAESMPHLWRIGQALEAQRDEDQGERRRIVAEAVAELDPTLAEVHEVEQRDRDDRERRAGHQPAASEAARAGIASRYAGLVSSTLIPVSRGTASGHAASNRPRAAPGSTHSGVAWMAECVRAASVGKRSGRAEQGDPEVLRQIARILDRPVGVVAERSGSRRSRAGTDGRRPG